MKICTNCYEEKELTEFYKQKNHKDGLSYQCKKCLIEKSRKYVASNLHTHRERCRAYRKKYYIENKDKIIKYNNEYKTTENGKRIVNKHIRSRRKRDSNFRIICTLRSRLYEILKQRSFRKNSKFNEVLGCSIDYLKNYLEGQFSPGMTWDNYGLWHIDHIIPLSSAETPERIYELCHYTNLQPLWAAENLRKSNKINKL